MAKGLKARFVDTDKVDGMRERAKVFMDVSDFRENGEQLKYFLEELGLWEEAGPGNSGGTQIAQQIISSLTEEMREKHFDDGQAIAAASGSFTALRELCPGETVTVAEMSGLLDAMLWRNRSKENKERDKEIRRQ